MTRKVMTIMRVIKGFTKWKISVRYEGLLKDIFLAEGFLQCTYKNVTYNRTLFVTSKKWFISLVPSEV